MMLPALNKKLDRNDYLLAGLLPLLGIFIIFGPQILNREGLFLGIIQEQYFLLGQFSFDHLIRSEFANGSFPLWNPDNGLGSVLLGNMLSAVFYPLKLFLYLFPALITYELYLVFRFWLAGFFSYLLGRHLGLSRSGSSFILFGFIFSGYFQFFPNENYLSADFLIPLLLLLALKISQSQSKKWPILLSLALFALFNSGHPEAIFYDWLFVLLSFIGWTVSREKTERPAAWVRFGLANLIALFLSLPLVLTFLEFWVRGDHFHLPVAGLYHYSISEFLAAFSPWFFGPGSPGAPFFHRPELAGYISFLHLNYQSSTLPWLAPSIGLIFLPLLPLAFLELKKLPKIHLIWMAWIIVFLGLSFGLTGFQFLGLVFPFSLSGNFKHPWPGIIFAAVLISAFLLEKILEGKIPTKKIVLAFLAAVILLLLFFPYDTFRPALNPFLAIELGSTMLFFLWLFFARGVSFSAPAGFCLASIVLLLSGQARRSWQEPIYLDYHLNELRANPVFQRIKADPLARFYFERGIFPPNLNQLLEVADLRVMDGVNHHRLVELVNRINGHSREQGFNYWYNDVGYLEVMPEKAEDPRLDLIGLKYVISRSPLPFNRSIERVLSSGIKRAPSPSHLGPAYFKLGNATAKTLFQHPPGLISFNRCDLYESDQARPGFCPSREKDHPPVVVPPLILSFAPRIQEEAVPKEPDGVWFIIGAEKKIGYARYLHPARHPEEQNLPAVELNLAMSETISLATLPADNSDFDWAGWLDLRVDTPRLAEKLELIGDQGFWFYQNPTAYPRFFLTGAGEMESGNGGKLKSKKELDPAILLPPGTPNSPEPRLGAEQSPLKLKKFSSQNFQIELEAVRNSRLLISQILFPGWKAILDGKEQELLPADFLTGLKIPPGKHHLKIFYQPWSFRIGLYFSLASLLGLIIFGIFRKRGA